MKIEIVVNIKSVRLEVEEAEVDAYFKDDPKAMEAIGRMVLLTLKKSAHFFGPESLVEDVEVE